MKSTILTLALFLSTAQCFEDKTISQWLSDNGFTVLVTDLKSAKLYQVLNGGESVSNSSDLERHMAVRYLFQNKGFYIWNREFVSGSYNSAVIAILGPFTVFAPTDAAFGKLSNSTVANLAANPAALETVLKYHVISGFVVGPQVQTGVTKDSLNGQALKFSRANSTLRVGNAIITGGDIILNNGVVHVIESVLLPLTDTISEILMKDQDRFGDLLLALTITDLFTPLLKGGPFTLFAPTNSAFRAIQDQLPDFSDPSAKAVYREILLNHVVNGTVMASDLRNGQQLTTLHGLDVPVVINAPRVTVSGSTVIQADLQAVNGVVHVIDSIMIPADMPPQT